jgi:hypothetical protein
MMAGLELTGPLNLTGRLVLSASGGNVKAGGFEVLVQLSAPGEPHHGTASPVILPPPPASPLDTGPNVWVISSFNQMVQIGTKPIVALGMVMQGQNPMWPGMVLPSQKNMQPTAVSVNGVPANVQNDQAMIFPTGVPAALGTSGQ